MMNGLVKLAQKINQQMPATSDRSDNAGTSSRAIQALLRDSAPALSTSTHRIRMPWVDDPLFPGQSMPLAPEDQRQAWNISPVQRILASPFYPITSNDPPEMSLAEARRRNYNYAPYSGKRGLEGHIQARQDANQAYQEYADELPADHWAHILYSNLRDQNRLRYLSPIYSWGFPGGSAFNHFRNIHIQPSDYDPERYNDPRRDPGWLLQHELMHNASSGFGDLEHHPMLWPLRKLGLLPDIPHRLREKEIYPVMQTEVLDPFRASKWARGHPEEARRLLRTPEGIDAILTGAYGNRYPRYEPRVEPGSPYYNWAVQANTLGGVDAPLAQTVYKAIGPALNFLNHIGSSRWAPHHSSSEDDPVNGPNAWKRIGPNMRPNFRRIDRERFGPQIYRNMREDNPEWYRRNILIPATFMSDLQRRRNSRLA